MKRNSLDRLVTFHTVLAQRLQESNPKGTRLAQEVIMVSDLSLQTTTQGDVRKTVTTTINAAFFQEIKDDHFELKAVLMELKKLLCSDNRLRVSRRFVSLLERLRDQVALHFSLEEAYGYFCDPHVGNPAISELAESLRAEHKTLYIQISEIVDHAAYVAGDKSCKRLWSQVVLRAESFYDALSEHERREVEMIIRAVSDEFGIGD